LSPLRLILLVVSVAGIATPAAATSAITIEEFGELCLERALFGRPVAPAAEEQGMEITTRISDAYAPDQYFMKVDGIPLSIVTVTGFVAVQFRAPMPEGIVVLSLGMSKTKAIDPTGRNVERVFCLVYSTEEPSAARALSEVQRELSDKFPRDAVAGEPYSRIWGSSTHDVIRWTWGDIDSPTGRFSVAYSGRAEPGAMREGMLIASRVVRAPE
jgi:hypothetical protein